MVTKKKLEKQINQSIKAREELILYKDNLCIELNKSRGVKYQSLQREYFGLSDKIGLLRDKTRFLIAKYDEI